MKLRVGIDVACRAAHQAACANEAGEFIFSGRRFRTNAKDLEELWPACRGEAAQADAGQVLCLYKGQEAVERRYPAFKGPLAVAALYLKTNRRIAALITVICLALLIFCLVERQVRQALAAQNATTLQGLYAGRPAIPTGRLIFDALAGIRIISGTGQSPPIIPQCVQIRLLGLVGVNHADLR